MGATPSPPSDIQYSKLSEGIIEQNTPSVSSHTSATLSPIPTPLGDLRNLSTQKLLCTLIMTLNAAYSDYDFSDLDPACFEPVVHGSSLLGTINENVLMPAEGVLPGLKRSVWKAVDDAIQIRGCVVFSFLSDPDNPVFSLGKLWSCNYFFFNKDLKRVLLFSCAAKSKLVSPMLTARTPRWDDLDSIDSLSGLGMNGSESKRRFRRNSRQEFDEDDEDNEIDETEDTEETAHQDDDLEGPDDEGIMNDVGMDAVTDEMASLEEQSKRNAARRHAKRNSFSGDDDNLLGDDLASPAAVAVIDLDMLDWEGLGLGVVDLPSAVWFSPALAARNPRDAFDLSNSSFSLSGDFVVPADPITMGGGGDSRRRFSSSSANSNPPFASPK